MDELVATWYLQAVSEDGIVVYTNRLTEPESAALNQTLLQMRGRFDNIDSVKLTSPMREVLEQYLSSGLLSAEALGLICGIDAKLLEAAANGADVQLTLEQGEWLAGILHAIDRNSAM